MIEDLGDLTIFRPQQDVKVLGLRRRVPYCGTKGTVDGDNSTPGVSIIAASLAMRYAQT